MLSFKLSAGAWGMVVSQEVLYRVAQNEQMDFKLLDFKFQFGNLVQYIHSIYMIVLCKLCDFIIAINT